MARGRQCKKKNPHRLRDAAAGSFWGQFSALWSFLAFLLGKGVTGVVQPLRAVPILQLHPGVPMHLRARGHTRVQAHGGVHRGVPRSWRCRCVHSGCRHAGGAPSPEPRGGKPAILRRAQPVSVQCQGRDYTGINILNSLSRPSDSKILTPAIALLPPGCGIPGFKPRCQVKWGELPWPPQPPKTPALRFFSSSLAILSVSPAAAGRRPHERFSCRLPPPNSW